MQKHEKYYYFAICYANSVKGSLKCHYKLHFFQEAHKSTMKCILSPNSSQEHILPMQSTKLEQISSHSNANLRFIYDMWIKDNFHCNPNEGISLTTDLFSSVNKISLPIHDIAVDNIYLSWIQWNIKLYQLWYEKKNSC